MLVALAVVTAVAAGGGWLAQRLGQPGCRVGGLDGAAYLLADAL